MKRLIENLAHRAKDDWVPHRYAPWLKSQFPDDVWNCELGGSLFLIDWRIEINGWMLTSPELFELCEIFKAWVILSTEPSSNEGREINDTGKHIHIKRTLRQIDYIVLHAVQWGITKYALRAVTEGDIARMLMAVEERSSDEESHYGWSKRLTEFLTEKGSSLSWRDMRHAISECPTLWDISTSDGDGILKMMPLPQLKRARAYLWLAGFYEKKMVDGFQYIPSTIMLAAQIYKNTLFGREAKSRPTELCFGDSEIYVREHPGLNVRTSTEGVATARRCRAQRAGLATLAGLRNFGFDVPSDAILRVLSLGAISVDAYRPEGRYRTPPFAQMMGSLRESIEFFQEHHAHIFKSYINCIVAAKNAKQPPAVLFFTTNIVEVLEAKTAQVGVKHWGLAANCLVRSNSHGRQRAPGREYFSAFRANAGLVELVGVLFGSIRFVIGVLSARRVGELEDLPIIGCTDHNCENLLFRNRKTGSHGVREIEIRPIPPICGKMIRALQDFHLGLEHAGIGSKGTLLCAPGYSGRYCKGTRRYNRGFDLLCDYFSTPLDKNGFRHYIRQHQLRRFFCISFFWGCKYSDMETLRWFLGHSDIEYLWHYITEAMDGDVLVYAKANFVSTHIDEIFSRHGDAPFFDIDEQSRSTLEEQVSKKFGTCLVSLIDTDALEEFIAFHMDSGLSVEPVFLDTPDGKKVRIAVHFVQTVAQ